MALDVTSLSIVRYPDPVLRRRAQRVEAITDEVRAVAARMIELMREAEGIGLAAPQVGLSWRLFVTHVPEGENRRVDSDPPTATAGPVVYVNPVLIGLTGPAEASEEGCLSIPEVSGEVLRPGQATIRATNLEGREFTQSAAGLLARCWQHEIDHLDGILILDRMTQTARLRNRMAVRSLERQAERG